MRVSNPNQYTKVTLMFQTVNPIIKHKAGLLDLAEETGNMLKACKIMGFWWGNFYRPEELAREGGNDALVNKNRRMPSHKNGSMKRLSKQF